MRYTENVLCIRSLISHVKGIERVGDFSNVLLPESLKAPGCGGAIHYVQVYDSRSEQLLGTYMVQLEAK